jgi:hypothetical protein
LFEQLALADELTIGYWVYRKMMGIELQTLFGQERLQLDMIRLRKFFEYLGPTCKKIDQVIS